MDTSKRSQSLHLLLGRRGEIVESWYNAIAQTSFTGLTAHETRSKLLKLTDQLINLLFSESTERREARAIGSELAGMHYSSPETLSRVQEVLASKFAEYLPDDQASMVQPRLAVLLAEIAAGFLEKTRDTILVEQEEVKAALLRERKRVEEALRESEASLAEAQRVAHLGHWEYHWDQNRLHWSDELYRIFGLSKQEFGGRFEDYFERVHPEDRELLVKVGEQLSRGETV